MKSDLGALRAVIRRSAHHLRWSTILLVGVACAAAAMLVFVEHGYQRMSRDFLDNDLARLLTVNKVVGAAGMIEPLTSAAVLDVASASGVGADVPGIVGLQYGLGVGIPAGEASVTVVGVDDWLAPLFGLPAMPESLEGFTESFSPGPLVLEVPHVLVEDGGYSSSDQTPLALTVPRGVDVRRLSFMMNGNIEGVTIVSADTFQSLAETMFQKDWAAINAGWSAGAYPMTPLVSAVHLIPASLNDVEPVAARLRDAGYPVSYAMSAFDETADGLRMQIALSGAVALLLILGALGYLLASWRIYLRLSRRDFGVLKHWGMSRHALNSVYGRVLDRSCVFAFAGATIVTIPLALVVLGAEWGLACAALNLASIGVLLLLANLVGRRVMLRKALSEPTASLLRLGREFQ